MIFDAAPRGTRPAATHLISASRRVPIISLVHGLPGFAIALACLLVVSSLGCGKREAEAKLAPSERIDFAQRLSYARVSGSPPAALSNEDSPPSSFHQLPGSTLRFGVLLPSQAMLRGELLPANGDTEQAPRDLESRIEVKLIDAAGEAHLLPTPGESKAGGFERDLMAWSAQPAVIEITLTGAARREAGPGIEWRNLRIEERDKRVLAGKEMPRAPYNVIVILLDSLRADHLSSYGDVDAATPNFASFSRYGVTFEMASSNSSWTLPSVASMFTGATPWEHRADSTNAILPEDVSYLPELLKRAGYRTECAIASAMVSEEFGFHRGYDAVYDLWNHDEVQMPLLPIRRASFLWSNYLEPLSKGDQPYFLFIHELDPHSPYAPHPPYQPKNLKESKELVVVGNSRQISQIRKHPDAISANQLEIMQALYDGEISAMDSEIGSLLKHAQAEGALKNTLVIFVSDHGEEFLDHRSAGHGHTVYQELLHVPLIVRLDRVISKGVRVSEPVELRDIAPTVLDLLGLETPSDMTGRSLVPLLAGDRFRTTRVSMASSRRPRLYSIRFGDWKLISPATRSARRHRRAQLFDLANDPTEQHNLIETHPTVFEALHQTLRAELREIRPTPRRKFSDLSQDVYRSLKALGYLDSSPSIEK